MKEEGKREYEVPGYSVNEWEVEERLSDDDEPIQYHIQFSELIGSPLKQEDLRASTMSK